MEEYENADPVVMPRWQQRFGNFGIAFSLMEEIVSLDVSALYDLEIEGSIHRFKFVFDMAIRVMTDFLEYQGIEVQIVTPRDIIKLAFASKLIEDATLWIEVLDMRRHIAHSYDIVLFRKFLLDFQEKYISLFGSLNDKLYAAL